MNKDLLYAVAAISIGVGVICLPLVFQRRPPAAQVSAGRDGTPHPLDAPAHQNFASDADSALAVQPCVATYERFRKIKAGFLKYRVDQIMGCEGELVSSSRVGDYNVETYSWQGNKFFSAMTVTYSNRRVQSTYQMNLR